MTGNEPEGEVDAVDDYIRVQYTKEAVTVEAASTSWRGTHTPVTTWHAVATLPPGASQEMISRAFRKARTDRRFFGSCRICRGRWPKGHLMRPDDQEGKVCHGCAEREFRIVF